MPLVDSADPTSQVYWTTTDILNFARVLVNDTQGTLSGQNLADNAPATWPLLNFCYAKLQNALEDSNVESVTYADAIVTVPGSGSYSDPASQSVLSYSGFTDAAGNTYDEPTLPPDLTMPLSLETRTAGQNAPFLPMAQRQGGLPSQFGNYRFLMWEFKQGGIYLLGGTERSAGHPYPLHPLSSRTSASAGRHGAGDPLGAGRAGAGVHDRSRVPGDSRRCQRSDDAGESGQRGHGAGEQVSQA